MKHKKFSNLDTLHLMGPQNFCQSRIYNHRDPRTGLDLLLDTQYIRQTFMHEWFVQLGFLVLSSFLNLLRGRFIDIIHSRVIQHNSKFATRIMQRLHHKRRTLPHPQRRRRPGPIKSISRFINQRYHEPLSKGHIFVFGLEHGKPVGVSGREREAILVRVRLCIIVVSPSIRACIVDLSSFAGWFG